MPFSSFTSLLTSTKGTRTKQFAIVAVFFSSVLFSLKAILVKYSYLQDSALDGVTLLTLRMCFALPFFVLMVMISTNRQTPRTADWMRLLISGFLGYYLASVLDFVGLEYITASLERIILFLYPTLTVLLTAVIYRRPLTGTILLSLLLSYGGTLVVMLAGDSIASGSFSSGSTESNVMLGSGLVFLAAICYASYLMLAKPLIEVFGQWRATGLTMMVACLSCLLHFLVFSDAPMDTLRALQPQSLWYGFLLGIFATLIPASLVIYGIARIGAANAALISAGGPVLTLLLAAFILGESLNGWQWLGCVANIMGVLLISLKNPS